MKTVIIEAVKEKIATEKQQKIKRETIKNIPSCDGKRDLAEKLNVNVIEEMDLVEKPNVIEEIDNKIRPQSLMSFKIGMPIIIAMALYCWWMYSSSSAADSDEPKNQDEAENEDENGHEKITVSSRDVKDLLLKFEAHRNTAPSDCNSKLPLLSIYN